MHSGALSEKVLLDLCCHLSKSLPAFLYFHDFPSLLDSPGRAEYWRFDLSDELSRTHRDYSILLFPLSTQWAEIQKKVLAQLFVDASLFASILFYIFKKKCSKGEQKVKVKIVSIYKLYILPPFLAHDVFHFPLFFTIHFHRFSFPLWHHDKKDAKIEDQLSHVTYLWGRFQKIEKNCQNSIGK